MGIQFEPSGMKKTSWKGYAVRFLFGGAVTALTGVLAKAFGPAIAGLFLAFPAILPASLALIDKSDGEKQAGFDAGGATIGSVGLVAFAVVVLGLAARTSAWHVLALAAIAWLAVAVAVAVWLAVVHYRKKL